MVEEREKALPQQPQTERLQKVKIAPTVQEVKVLTQSMLDAAIPAVREYFLKANKNMELAILDQPIKVEDGKVFLQVLGSFQEQIANKMAPEFLDILRNLSGANQLSVSVELKEEIQNGRPKLYTDTEKLRFLKEKYPSLIELQRKFGLEVDF